MLPDSSEQSSKGVLFVFNQLCLEPVLHSVCLDCFHKMQFQRVVTHKKLVSHTFSSWIFKFVSVPSSFPSAVALNPATVSLRVLGKLEC